MSNVVLSGSGNVPPPPPGLSDGLVHRWPMNEFSDGSSAVTRSDVVGSEDLIDQNTTPSGVGTDGNCASFARANSEHLEAAKVSSFQGNGKEFYCALWLNTADVTTSQYFFDAGAFEWRSRVFASFVRTQIRSTQPALVTMASLAVTANAWHLFEFYHSNTDQEAGVALDNGSFQVTDLAPYQINTDASDLTFGSAINGSLGFTGRVDDVVIYNGRRIWEEAAARSQIWNGGAGGAFA